MRDSCSSRPDSKAVSRSAGLSLYGHTTAGQRTVKRRMGCSTPQGALEKTAVQGSNTSAASRSFDSYRLVVMIFEHPIGWLPMPLSALWSRLPELATASMYWPLMTPSCLGKTKPSIRGAAGTDGSCVNPPWTHQSFQSLLNPFICHSFHKTKTQISKVTLTP